MTSCLDDPYTAEFVAWLREKDADELLEYWATLLDLIEDDGEHAGQAASQVPFVKAIATECGAKEMLAEVWAEEFPGVDLDLVWPHIVAIHRARRQLGEPDDPAAVLSGALEVEQAKRLRLNKRSA